MLNIIIKYVILWKIILIISNMLFCIYFSQYAKLRDYNEAITIKNLIVENVYYKFNHSYIHILRDEIAFFSRKK